MKGPSFGRRLLVVAGYSAFFLFALVLFVFLTLPLDTVKAYLVRKAADEYNADLVIEDLSTWGLTGIEAENVTLTFRPTPEEEAAMEAAREARKAWEATHGGAKKSAAATADEGGDAKAPESAEGDTADKKVAAKRTAEPGGDVDEAPKGDKPAEEKSDGAPPMPSGPRPITVEHLKAKVGLLALMRGAKAGAVEAGLGGGTLEAELDHNGEAYHLTGKWDAIDLRQLAFLRRKVDLPLAGTLAGEVDVEVPTADEGKVKLANAVGHVSLKIADASLGPGTLATFELPLTRINAIDGKLVLDKKKATVDHFDITGKDLEGELTGYIDLKESFARFGPRVHLRFKLGDEFLEAHKDLKTLLTLTPKVKNATSEGYTGVMINGTFSDPKLVWRKDSPYKAGSPGASASPGDARKKDKPAGKEKKPGRAPKNGLTTGTTTALPPKPTTLPVPSTTKSEPVPPPTPEVVPEPVVEAPPPVEEPVPEPEAPAEPVAVPEPEAPANPEGAAPEGTENPEAPAEPPAEE
jgi:type II secretion system protein N